jgi:hypothetical protein
MEAFISKGFFKAGRQIDGDCQQKCQQKTGFCATRQEFGLTLSDSPTAP